ncbi:hypothetical protein B9Z55_006162 [Caenorhabditis nigoni]|uniref:Uncharacterized protein n=1 Tax=Caenorhabditis nigoni TaxID=1611254 RepID=A0A2G5V3X6_9PELO|nr:hypothetical protein B9Z55_006162 [Caenorhabditis nigoni]
MTQENLELPPLHSPSLPSPLSGLCWLSWLPWLSPGSPGLLQAVHPLWKIPKVDLEDRGGFIWNRYDETLNSVPSV